MACNVTLSSIAQTCDANLSGIKKIAVANYQEGAFKLDTTAAGNKVLVTIDEKVTDWVELIPARETGSYTTTLTRNDTTGVLYYTQELTATFNKMDANNAAAVDALGQGRVVLVAQDYNGINHCVGLDDYVMASAITGQTGAARDDGNNYQVTLQGISAHVDYICAEYPTIAGA